MTDQETATVQSTNVQYRVDISHKKAFSKEKKKEEMQETKPDLMMYDDGYNVANSADSLKAEGW